MLPSKQVFIFFFNNCGLDSGYASRPFMRVWHKVADKGFEDHREIVAGKVGLK